MRNNNTCCGCSLVFLHDEFMTSIIANGRFSLNHECGVNVSLNDQLQALEDWSSKKRTVAHASKNLPWNPLMHDRRSASYLKYHPHSHHPKCKQPRCMWRVSQVSPRQFQNLATFPDPNMSVSPRLDGLYVQWWKPWNQCRFRQILFGVKARHYMSVTSNCS